MSTEAEVGGILSCYIGKTTPERKDYIMDELVGRWRREMFRSRHI